MDGWMEEGLDRSVVVLVLFLLSSIGSLNFGSFSFILPSFKIEFIIN